jgi:hypothetical protein
VPVASRHLLRQRRVIGALGGTAARALLRGMHLRPDRGSGPLPGREVTAVVAPPAPALVRDYLLHLGADPVSYDGVLPPHLFPHWAFPLAARTLRALPYPLMRMVNAGCRLEVRAPLPAGVPLQVRARLEDIDDDGRRAVLHQRLVTGTAANPDAVVADVYAVVVLAPGEGRPQPARVPEGARELARWALSARAARSYALLTGDVNPVHWLPPYARAFGYRGTILHGFATLARVMEGLGGVPPVRLLDVKLTRPLVLPARVGLYVDGPGVFVGDAPGAPAYLTGRWAEAGAGAADR